MSPSRRPPLSKLVMVCALLSATASALVRVPELQDEAVAWLQSTFASTPSTRRGTERRACEAGGFFGVGCFVKNRPELFPNVGYVINEGGLA